MTLIPAKDCKKKAFIQLQWFFLGSNIQLEVGRIKEDRRRLISDRIDQHRHATSN